MRNKYQEKRLEERNRASKIPIDIFPVKKGDPGVIDSFEPDDDNDIWVKVLMDEPEQYQWFQLTGEEGFKSEISEDILHIKHGNKKSDKKDIKYIDQFNILGKNHEYAGLYKNMRVHSNIGYDPETTTYFIDDEKEDSLDDITIKEKKKNVRKKK